MNQLKAFLLLGVLSVLLVWLGKAIGGNTGAMVFLAISLGINLFSYFYSDKMVIKMTGAQPVSQVQAPQLYAMVQGLAQRAGIPAPRLYLMPSPQPNAFATGRNPQHGVVVVTEGLLRVLDQHEVEGVIAHEMAHIKNRDVLVGTVAASIAGAISMIANVIQWGAMFGGLGGGDDEDGLGLVGMLVMAIVAPIAALIVQMAISRSREYQADATGASLAGSPSGLSSALLKLEQASQGIPMQVSPAASHLFIVNPLSAQRLASLFSTHPSTADRVERLKAMRIA